jgi:CheY-like chemotaxis protein
MSTSVHQGSGTGAGPREPQRALSIVIVDDERLARQRLRRLLGNIAGVEVVAECALGAEAVETALRLRPDVMLLDIQMPDVDGFGALERMLDESERQGYDAKGASGEGPRVPLVIFVTAFDEYALRAFDVHAVDYVLKPVDEARLAEAIERARHTLRTTALAEAHERLMVATEALMRARRTGTAAPDADGSVEPPAAGERGTMPDRRRRSPTDSTCATADAASSCGSATSTWSRRAGTTRSSTPAARGTCCASGWSSSSACSSRTASRGSIARRS